MSRAMIANEKRRRRRESHNAVERRRRDNINEKITELATLIPECILDPAGTPLYLFLSPYLHSYIHCSLRPSVHANSDFPHTRGRPVRKPDSRRRCPGCSRRGLRKERGCSRYDRQSKQGYDPAQECGVHSVCILFLQLAATCVLRDSYRYLQQLVTAQANRNRELEAQIGVLCPSETSPNPVSSRHNDTHSINGNGSTAEELVLHDELHHHGSSKWEHALSSLAESESDDVDMEGESVASAERGRQRHRVGLSEDVRIKQEGMEVS